MTYEIALKFPHEIIFQTEGPFVTLFQPTHRNFPDNRQDTIVYKNLLRTIETSLNQTFDKNLVSTMMTPLYELEEDKDFWNNTLDGLAVLVSQSDCIIYNLQESVDEFATVANSFHIKPLIKAFQSLETYHLLGLSRSNFTLYQGNRNGFTEIDLSEKTPNQIKEILGEQSGESYLSHGSYGGAAGNAMYHGHGDAKQETDIDTEKFFRYVDRFILENFSNPLKTPLILVALGEYHSHFKNISANPYILDVGITKSHDSMDLDEINEKVLELIEPIHFEKMQDLIDIYKKSEADSLGSADVAIISLAAFNSRVGTLLIEENKIVAGKIDNQTGYVRFGELNDPDVDDILDDLAELTLSRKGDVFILPKDKMPCTSGVCAIFRY